MGSTILVLGAGVCGLTSALELSKAYPNAKIIVAGHFIPGDIDITYTSPFAGANWHSFSEDDDKVLQDYDKPGYRKFLELAENPQLGVWIKKSYAYLTKEKYELLGRDSSIHFKWIKNFVDDYTVISEKELPDGVALGFHFKGVVISTPIYLNFLVQQLLARGVSVNRTKNFKTVQEAKERFGADVVVNCTGGQAKALSDVVDSKRNYPVKGQVLHVSNTGTYKMSVSDFVPDYPDELLYIMPRKEGGCIIGGLMSEDVTRVDEDKGLTQRIIQRAIKYMPELVDPKFHGNPEYLDIIKVNVGLRPAREGGVRVDNDPEKKWLVHNYGAGGGGYQGSYGFAAKVVKLVGEKISETSFRTSKI